MIPIPLAAPDPDVLLDLQSVFSLTYERGRYQRWIDYRQFLVPALSEQDRHWVDMLLQDSSR